MTMKSEKLAQQLEALKEQIAEAERREAEAAEAEMLRLIRKAGCVQEAIEFARQKLAVKRERRGKSTKRNLPGSNETGADA